MYHPYVRPSTEEIVARLYPRRNGDRIKVYPSGATLKGRVVNEVFQVGTIILAAQSDERFVREKHTLSALRTAKTHT